jgi:hypothetical protein
MGSRFVSCAASSVELGSAVSGRPRTVGGVAEITTAAGVIMSDAEAGPEEGVSAADAAPEEGAEATEVGGNVGEGSVVALGAAEDEDEGTC